MAKDTTIEWCDSTVNPTERCDGCELWNPARKVRICYAGRITEARNGPGSFLGGVLPKPGRTKEAAGWSDLAGKARPEKPWIPARLPRLVFISDMSDALSASVTTDFLRAEIIEVVAKWPHIGLWLTKRPSQMVAFDKWLARNGVAWPDNLWAGTSVTMPGTERRIMELYKLRAARLFASVEPAFEGVKLASVLEQHFVYGKCGNASQGNTCLKCGSSQGRNRKLDQVIIGGESGKEAKETPVERIQHLVAECEWAGVGIFVKQLGSKPTLNGVRLPEHQPDEKWGDWDRWPFESLKRREFPAWTAAPVQRMLFE